MSFLFKMLQVCCMLKKAIIVYTQGLLTSSETVWSCDGPATSLSVSGSVLNVFTHINIFDERSKQSICIYKVQIL